MRSNPYRKFMKVAAWIAGIGAFIALACALCSIFVKDLQIVLIYVAMGGACLAVIAIIALLAVMSISIRKREREESDLFRDFHLVASGEKKLIPEKGNFYKDVRREFNRTNLSGQSILPYGDYEEDEFDDVVLDTLENGLTASAGLAYLELIAPKKIRTSGPVEALLVMAKSHFGEKAYFGKLDNGVAVFVPLLGSHEEMMGKVRKVVQLYSYSEEDNHINVKAGIAFYPEIPPRNMTSSALKATVTASPLQASAAEAQVPLVGYKAAEIVSIMYAGKLMTKRLQNQLTRAECRDAFHRFAKIALSSLGADSIDVLTFDLPRGQYVIEEEITRNEGAGFQKLSHDGMVDSEILQPIYDWSVREQGAVAASKAVYLPESIKARLDNLGMMSIMALAVQVDNRLVGLLIVGSSERELDLSYGAQRYFAFPA